MDPTVFRSAVGLPRLPALTALLLATAVAAGMPRTVLGQSAGVYRDPAPLHRLLGLSDGDLRTEIAAQGGQSFRTLVSAFEATAPEGMPSSHGFLGPRAACLADRRVEACRIYLHDLVQIQQDLQDRGLPRAAAELAE